MVAIFVDNINHATTISNIYAKSIRNKYRIVSDTYKFRRHNSKNKIPGDDNEEKKMNEILKTISFHSSLWLI